MIALGLIGMAWGVMRPWPGLLEEPPRVLWSAYREGISGFKHTSQGWVFLLRNGIAVPYSDGKRLSVEARMEDSDLESMLLQAYPFATQDIPVPAGHEAGRFRNYALLKAVYGATPDEVKRALVTVDFAGLALEFNQNNGAAEALHRVGQELQSDPEAWAYVKWVAGLRLDGPRGMKLKRSPNIGTWNWRTIAGTERLSAHSFGIAIDLNKPKMKRPSYWRWVNAKKYPRGFESVQELEPVPWTVVDIFERHGFIWGGKWHHFDTMHFEYRPEFIKRMTREE